LGVDNFEREFAAGFALSVEEAAALSDVARKAPASVAPEVASETTSAVDALSPREREVAALIARGFTSEAIADALIISKRTADTHAAHIRDKLGLRSRAEIAAWATRNGLT
jgi:DNA-binding CsgD family transcriptional regulator